MWFVCSSHARSAIVGSINCILCHPLILFYPCLSFCLVPGEGSDYLGCSFGGALISPDHLGFQSKGVQRVREASSGSPSAGRVDSNYYGPWAMGNIARQIGLAKTEGKVHFLKYDCFYVQQRLDFCSCHILDLERPKERKRKQPGEKW